MHGNRTGKPGAQIFQVVAENVNADTAQARSHYQAFVDAYPNHSLAKDASFSLANLGKTDEELIRMFEQNLNAQE